ncbi:MAG: MFS transporter, partial [Pseudothermotoga sp.]
RKVPYTFEELVKTFKQPKVASLLFTRLFYSLGFTTFESSFTLFAIRRLNLELSQTSFVLAYVGVVLVITQGLLVGKVAKKFAEYVVVKYLMPLAILLLAVYSFSSNLATLVLFLTPLSISSGLIGVSITSLTTKSVSKDKLGGTLGIFSSADSLVRIVSPLIGAVVIQYVGSRFLGVVVAFFVSIGFVIFRTKFLPNLATMTKHTTV